jgi:hypothetical protein
MIKLLNIFLLVFALCTLQLFYSAFEFNYRAIETTGRVLKIEEVRRNSDQENPNTDNDYIGYLITTEFFDNAGKAVQFSDYGSQMTQVGDTIAVFYYPNYQQRGTTKAVLSKQGNYSPLLSCLILLGVILFGRNYLLKNRTRAL